jgi:hypothetical protein
MPRRSPAGIRVIVFQSGTLSDMSLASINRLIAGISSAKNAMSPQLLDVQRPVDLEVLNSGTFHRFVHVSETAGHSVGGQFGADERRLVMDKHRLDVALSIGRHAAERAKLAAYAVVIGLGTDGSPCGDSVDWRVNLHTILPGTAFQHGLVPGVDIFSAGRHLHPLEEALTDPYDNLHRLGRFEVAALVGLAIAGAQIGLSVTMVGTAGCLAAMIARRLHPGVAEWLSVDDEWPSAIETQRDGDLAPGRSVLPLGAASALIAEDASA